MKNQDIIKLALLSAAILTIICSCNRPEEDPGYVWEPEDQVEYVTLQKRSAKRGVSFNLGDFPSNDIPLLGTGCSWSYNWGPGTTDQAFSLFSRYEMDFCPMAWNAAWDEDAIRKLKASHPECRYILAITTFWKHLKRGSPSWERYMSICPPSTRRYGTSRDR